MNDHNNHNNQNNQNNLYTILNVNISASQDEIKKSYHKLALKYHPDRENGNREKFVSILHAYEILGNINKRYVYDNSYDNSCDNSYDNSYDAYDGIYCDDIYEQNIEFVVNYFRDLINSATHNDTLNIIDSVSCDLVNRINDDYLYVEISRKTRENIHLYVPLRNEKNIFVGEGEISNGLCGDIILNTITNNKCEFTIIDCDLYKKINTNNDFTYFNDINLNEHEYDVLDNNCIVFKKLGLPTDDGDIGDLIFDPN